MSAPMIDVFVAGGGPAGLAFAIAARMRGLKVALADSARPPIDKACGEGIMPVGVIVLGNLGIELAELESVRFRGIKFVCGGTKVTASFSHGSGYGVRRTTLHRAMAERAQVCGVELHWGRRVTGVTSRGVLLDGEEVKARYVVCADGQTSALRSAAGFSSGRTITQRYGFRQHFAVRPWSEFVEVYWTEAGQIYVTPVSEGEIGLALLTRDKHVGLDDVISSVQELSERLRGQKRTSRLAGAVTVTRYLPEVVRGNVALLGDASGSADAITGDGLSLAFREAMVLADAILRNELATYATGHRAIARRPLGMGRALLLLDGRPALRRLVFSAFHASPDLFSVLLRFHTGGRELSAEPHKVGAAA